MARGGKRPGAGRKRALTVRQEIAIGAACEGRWRAVCRQREDEARSARSQALLAAWARAASVPLDERPGWHDSVAGQDHREDVADALRDEQGIDLAGDDEPAEPARVRTIRPARPWGARAVIVAVVARESGISTRRVEAAWKVFRHLQAEISEND